MAQVESSVDEFGGALEDDLILDLTCAQLHDLADVEFRHTLEEVDLTTNRLSALDDRIGRLPNLKKLSLRQNLLQDAALEALATWPIPTPLKELVLRDNKLTKMPPLLRFTQLLLLDVSFNELRSLVGLRQAPKILEELYVSKNELVVIEELDHLRELRILELGSNNIRLLDGLNSLAKLTELWLGRNRIRDVNLCGLTGLLKISLQSNRLTTIRGFEECHALEELYLSHNGISVMEGLSALTSLRILDLSSNRISAIADVDTLTTLEDLWLNDNLIPTLDGIEVALAGPKLTLTTIYLERNPCAGDPDYYKKLRLVLPQLQQVDSHLCS
eukprot:TRINITY_DN10950_c0_g1_i1.p1 TRINITY_DN10950_c0_g1~~TRINITY_DN10950_c0_g1_i1.p1  ORF type:complete len:330 (+),score=69.67 TRINITY_DN10950_c0_g1_i1:247-1236(+)